MLCAVAIIAIVSVSATLFVILYAACVLAARASVYYGDSPEDKEGTMDGM